MKTMSDGRRNRGHGLGGLLCALALSLSGCSADRTGSDAGGLKADQGAPDDGSSVPTAVPEHSEAGAPLRPADGSTTTLADATVDGPTDATVGPSTDATTDVPADALAPDVGSSQPDTKSEAFVVGLCAKPRHAAAIADIGVRWVRADNPTADDIRAARRAGVEILPLATYAGVEFSGNADDKYPPTPDRRVQWARAKIDMWRDMAEPPRVIEVWNEPWHHNFWKPFPVPADYLALVKVFAEEAWKVWPDVTLLVSADQGMARDPIDHDFRDKLLAADAEGFLSDPRILPTTHNYVEGRTPQESTERPCLWALDRFKCAYEDFRAHGHPDPQVWITEFGWESTPVSGTTEESSFGTVTRSQQASYTLEAYEMFRASGMVAGAFAFVYRAEPDHRSNWTFNWLDPDGNDKPVVGALRRYLENDP